MTIQRLQVTRLARFTLLTSLLIGSSASVGAADTGASHRLNPGVRPGDVVVLRRVEPVPVGRSDRHDGPIEARVNARDNAMALQQRLTGIQAISLSDERAAGIRGSVGGSMGPLHRALGTDSQLSRGTTASAGGSHRAPASLGGGSATGSIGSITSGLSGTVGKALSPLTGRN